MNRKALEMLAGGRYLEEEKVSDLGERDLAMEAQVRKMLQLIGENPGA